VFPPTTPNDLSIDDLSEKELAKLFGELDEFAPTIPDALTQHHLKISGVRDADVRVTRLVSLAAQKIISQIVTDARICAQQRLEMQAKDKRERGFDPKDRRVVMTLEDLMAALTDYGLGIRKPAYFVGGVTE